MPALPLLAVVFVGIGGADGARVDRQMQSLLHKEAKIEAAKVSPAQLKTLTRHADGCKAIVRNLHADGVVAGELVEGHGGLTLRVVVYDGDGGMKDLVETPLSGRALGRPELETLRSNLLPDLQDLGAGKDGDGDDGGGGGGGGGGIDDGNDSSSSDSADDVPTPAKLVRAAPKHEAAPARHQPVKQQQDDEPKAHEAAPTETADIGGAADAAESTGAADGEVLADSAAAELDALAASASDDDEPTLHMRASIGFGLAGRDFAPGPSTVAGYSSTPVGAVRLDGQIQPSQRTAIAIIAERTLGMTSPVTEGTAATTMSRWQVSGAYAVVRGAVQIAPILGLGLRSFTMDSKDPSRSPDGHYTYLVVGTTVSAPIGQRVTLGGTVAFEPVVAGAEPTELAFGEASRWALDVGAAVDVRATEHLFVRAAADYQRFEWSWDMAGARGAGGAVDSYPTGTISLGADY